VLRHLQSRPGPATASEVAGALRIHANTAREHLEGLTRAGFLVRSRQQPRGRGRPCTLYGVDPSGGKESVAPEYAALAGVLAAVISRGSDSPGEDAGRAGRAWGAALAGDERPPTAAGARRRVVHVLAEMGFEPRADRPALSAALTRCPLLEVARLHTEVVCSVHLGLVQGLMESMGHDPGRVALAPFAEPGACRLDFGSEGPGSA
jgi:predicted ArsR family transcriptional regulator